MAERVQGGRLVARALAAHGVDAIFTLSGGHVMPIYEGCRHEGVRVVDVRHELAQPRGPAYLEVPMDVLCEEATATDHASPARTDARAFGDPRELMKAADLLTQAERPAVIAGSGIWWDSAWKQLAQLAENGRLPIYLNGSGRGALPPEHELFFQHSRGTALDAADVVCVVGTPLDFRLKFGRFGDDTKLVHVHADATELGRNRTPDAGIVGDCAAVLGILADGVKLPTDRR